MRFLITAMPRHPVTPEILLGLVTAMRVYRQKYSDKTEQDWAFAGLGGGGAIVNADSHEELDEMMGEFPFGPFAEVEIRAISDLDTWLDNATSRLEALAQGTPH